tara:strand:+ start:283 stop:744 length:462 start_codon:yes stop_codon:yes gene_type:complete
MEFIVFLNKIDREIIDLIRKADYSIEENTSLCLINKRFIGFHKKVEKSIVICTNNAKKIGNFRKKSANNNDNHKTKLVIRRGLRHEATHMAQSCNNDKVTGIIENLDKKLNKNKLNALNSSVKISGNLKKEVEAYVMEDKPRKVKEAIEKYCL